MDVSALTSGAGDAEADLLGVLVAEPPELGPAARELDEALGGALSRLVDGRRRHRRARLGHAAPPRRGVRPEADRRRRARPADRATAEDARIAAAAAVAKLGEQGGRTVAWLLDAAGAALAPDELARALVDGLALGPHSAARWRSSDPPGDPVERARARRARRGGRPRGGPPRGRRRPLGEPLPRPRERAAERADADRPRGRRRGDRRHRARRSTRPCSARPSSRRPAWARSSRSRAGATRSRG